jgi:tRNA (Thr-GGU) A37 N-methylase
VRPPRLGGNKAWACSPPAPPIDPTASASRWCAWKGRAGRLLLSGIDLLDGTPVLDIKPYVPYADSILEATNRSPARHRA